MLNLIEDPLADHMREIAVLSMPLWTRVTIQLQLQWTMVGERGL
ncbi:MAG: hypothetical protein WBG48_07865 [Pricia sp.]